MYTLAPKMKQKWLYNLKNFTKPLSLFFTPSPVFSKSVFYLKEEIRFLNLKILFFAENVVTVVCNAKILNCSGQSYKTFFLVIFLVVANCHLTN
jgi:hypothetical protein